MPPRELEKDPFQLIDFLNLACSKYLIHDDFNIKSAQVAEALKSYFLAPILQVLIPKRE